MNINKELFLFQIVFIIGLISGVGTVPSVKAQQILKVTSIIDKDTSNVIKDIFDIPELKVSPSPNAAQSITFPESEKVIDYDVSPSGKNVATLIIDKNGRSIIKFWQYDADNIIDSLLLMNGLIAKDIVWHPNANALFLLGVKDAKYQIFRIRKIKNDWVGNSIFSTSSPLRRLVICPRPFITGYDEKSDKSYFNYRLYFGMDNGNQTFRIVSITETGNKFYQVVGPFKTITKLGDDEEAPSTMVSEYALPIAFHPAGHELIWEDQLNNFYCASYDSRYWGKSRLMDKTIQTHGTITPTPNGLGLIHWQKNKPGIGVYLWTSKKETAQLENYRFVSTPSSVPDGKGIVGLTHTAKCSVLNYLPIAVSMADVVNAWMYVRTENEKNLFQKNYGLFRPNQYDQLYKLYDSENYACGDFDRGTPTRPYLVTTDIFWELFGAAYQGIFIVKERDEAMPNFRKFISSAHTYTTKTGNVSDWKNVFEVLQGFLSDDSQNPEVMKIRNEQDALSVVTGKEYAYSDLKPRGHYTSSVEMKNYFKAFRYFTTIFKSNQKIVNELNLLPDSIKVYAEKWIESYNGFISPSRSPLVWANVKMSVPKYTRYPQNELAIFPLSWGFDNEVLYSTVYHENVPADLQLPLRFLPTGLDLATVLGNGLAEKLLKSDFTKYPNLHNVIANLKSNYKLNSFHSDNKNNLYGSWMDAIAVQWADTLSSVNGNKDVDIWKTKRLQTGLATWATLRHATVLVNERTSAECGEGGFEEILMRAPRGYVEPDPDTFAAIADLFETAIQYVSKSISDKKDTMHDFEWEKTAKLSLYDGIIVRLKEVAKDARSFQAMAEKERKGELLSNEENTKIFFIGGTAEHNFLVFNSLSNKDYALSNPVPIAKIADVAGGGKWPYLMSAVGNAMEWNHIVPFYGRHEIVKGSIYSYYEFESKQVLNDKEWQKKASRQGFLPWLIPFITNQSAAERAETGY